MAASGNYIGGTLWPPVLQHAMATAGWRHTYLGVGIFCVLATLPFIFALRRRAPAHPIAWMSEAASTGPARNLGVSPNALMVLLCVAGLACCVAMAMPQVHIVAYCGDLGYGPARGAEMLSAMLGFGILSRIGSGLIADRLGGVATLLIGSVLQGIALFLYLLFDGLVSLYIISALFGLFQGGIVPMYAIIVREYFSPKEVGIRIGIVLMATLFGMALGGWMSGVIFDHTGSYRAAFLNGLIWNMVNAVIVLWLMLRLPADWPQCSHRHCDRQTVVGRELHRWPELRGRRMGRFRGNSATRRVRRVCRFHCAGRRSRSAWSEAPRRRSPAPCVWFPHRRRQ